MFTYSDQFYIMVTVSLWNRGISGFTNLLEDYRQILQRNAQDGSSRSLLLLTMAERHIVQGRACERDSSPSLSCSTAFMVIRLECRYVHPCLLSSVFRLDICALELVLIVSLKCQQEDRLFFFPLLYSLCQDLKFRVKSNLRGLDAGRISFCKAYRLFCSCLSS